MAIETPLKPPASGLSGTGRADLTRVLGRGRRLITVDDAADALGVGRTEAAKRLAFWAEQGWLRRARRGLYIPVPVDAERPEEWTDDPFYLASAVWEPVFITGWTAANHWGLTDQVFRTTVAKTGQRVRKTAAHLAGQEFILIHAGENEFGWGTRGEWRHDRRVDIADPARTVIDIADKPAIGGGIRLAAEILESYLLEGSATTLVDYGDRLGNRAIFKRIGFLTEALRLDEPELVDACLSRRSKGDVLLDPSGEPKGPRKSRWGIRVNINLDSAR